MDTNIVSDKEYSTISTDIPRRPSVHSRRSSDIHHRTASLHTVRGFTPEPVSPLAHHPHTSPNRSSGLSASLASSSFHHPSQSQDATGYEFTHRVDAQSKPGATVLNFKRKTDDELDMATSYRFFLVEEQMKQRQQQADERLDPSQTSNLNLDPVNNNNNNGTSKTADPVVTMDPPRPVTPEQTPTSPSGKSSKKKVVTFDVKPAIVTITREVDAEKAQEAAENLGSQDLVFDLEEDDPGYASGESSLPPFLREPVVAPRYSSRPTHKSDNSGMSASYQAVRPSSLPTPSSFASYRPSPLRTLPEVSSPLSQPPAEPSIPEAKKPQQQPQPRPQPPTAADTHDPRNLQILNLVAAHVPSHRGKWQPGSREWDAFVKRPDGREDAEEDSRPSEHEVEPTFVGSLPVPIKPHRMPKEELSLASYKPKATLDDGAHATSVPTISHRRTSSSIRKATYAERDKARSIDPGALDFAVEDDSDDTADEDNERPNDRASRFALRILHARNSVPEAGVWRSLA